MKLWVLMENTPCCPEMASEHGLSFYLETATHNILFDAGQSAAFADNAQRMGVDLSKVDVAILSHGHYDHSGGLARFFQLNHHAPVYLHPLALGDQCHGESRYIGIDPALKDNPRLIPVDRDFAISPTVTLRSCNEKNRPYPTNSDGLTVKQGDHIAPDTFLHEQYLEIQDKGRSILISGCSHKGILNIMDWFAPDILVGGFHFMNVDTTSGASPVLDHAAQVLCQYNTQYYTCHCTGLAPYQYLKALMGPQLHALTAGDVVEL